MLEDHVGACKQAVGVGDLRRVAESRAQVARIWEQAQLALSLFEKKCDELGDVRLSPMPDLSSLNSIPAGMPPSSSSSLPSGWESRGNTMREEELVAKGSILQPTILQEQGKRS